MAFTFRIPELSVPDIGDYFWAVVRSWCGIMTGGVVGVALFFWSLTGTPIYPIIGLFICIGAIFVACYRLWREERQNKINQIDKLASELGVERQKATSLETGRRPKILGFFQGSRATEYYATNDGGFTYDGELIGMFFNVKIAFVNEGEVPTSIHNFSLTVKGNGKEVVCEKPEKPLSSYDDSEIFGVPTELDKFVLDSEKMTTKGKRVEGELEFKVEGITPNDLGESWDLTVNIEDAWGEQHSIVTWGKIPKS
ncbi:MAG: hypothetical protein ACKVQW_14760 [Pyrinomonadaceae bacterium]